MIVTPVVCGYISQTKMDKEGFPRVVDATVGKDIPHVFETQISLR
jgi:hypothetical protein